jgi:hypothetical protein
MADAPDNPGTVNSISPQDSSLPDMGVERDRLCKELDEARQENRRLFCQAEMLRQEWYRAKAQEEEYRRCIHKLTGFDPYLSPQEILDIERGGVTMKQIIAEIEKETGFKRDGA